MEPKPTVSLCMIVRNEEHSLPGCLESVKGLVDEIVIVDTGSTDQTAKVARSHGARVIPFTWTDDFSAARNESLRHAQGDWIFYLDADERLIRAGVEDCLRAAAAIPGVDARSVLIKNRLSEAEDDFNITSNIRLFRRIPGIRFEGEVHERVELFLARRGACVTPAPFRIDHLGYAGGESVLKDKLRRNLALSLRRCAEAPDDAYALHYLGQTLLLLDRKEESRDALERALHTNDLPRYLHCIILDLLACIDLSEGRFDEAIARAESSLSMTPRQSSARLTIGLARYQQRDFAAALPHLRHAYQFLRLPPESRPTELSQDYSFVQPADILKALAVCHAETGKYATAIPLFRRYLDARGEDGDILRQIGICHLNEGDYWNAFQYLRRAETMGVPRPHLAVPMAYCALQLQDFPIARQILDDAVRPEDAAMRQKIEQILDDLQKHREDARRAKPSISLCMIVKNEESHLAGCLESVRSSVDEIVIVDTGSADRTVEIARSFGADVYPFPWRNDFAAARNEGLAHARGDWVLYLDADERLNDMGDPDCLHTACAAPGIDAYSVPIVNHKGGRERGEFHVGYAIRLFRRYPGIRFTGRVHERTDAFLEKAGASVARSRFLIEHLGYDVERSGIEAKYRRNLELLREQLQEDPGDTHALYHVGITLLGLERERESREVFEALLSRGGLPPQLQAVCLNMVSFFLLNEREYAGALRAACDSLAAVPRQNTAKVLAGLAHSRLGEFERAFPFLFEAFQYTDLPPEKRLTDLHHEDTVPRGELLKALATCCAETGKCRQAIVFFARCIEEGMRDADIFRSLGLCRLNTQDYAGAVESLTHAKALGADPVGLLLPLAFACFCTGDFQRSRDCFLESRETTPDACRIAMKLLEAMARSPEYAPFFPETWRWKNALVRQASPEDVKALAAAMAAGGHAAPAPAPATLRRNGLSAGSPPTEITRTKKT